MSHVIELSDEQYATLEHAAQERGQTLDALMAQMINDVRSTSTKPHYYATVDEFARHLGMSEEDIEESKRLAAEMEAADFGADV